MLPKWFTLSACLSEIVYVLLKSCSIRQAKIELLASTRVEKAKNWGFKSLNLFVPVRQPNVREMPYIRLANGDEKVKEFV